MEKKRSFGVSIFGSVILIIGILAILWNVKHFPSDADARVKSFFVICDSLLVSSIVYGTGVLLLREWARKLALAINIAVLIIYPALLFFWKIPTSSFEAAVSTAFPVAILCFFTRSGVRKQFK